MGALKYFFVLTIMVICFTSSSCFDIGRIFGLRAAEEVDAKSPYEFSEFSGEDVPTKKPLLSLSNLPGIPTLHIGDKPNDGKPQKPTVKYVLFIAAYVDFSRSFKFI